MFTCEKTFSNKVTVIFPESCFFNRPMALNSVFRSPLIDCLPPVEGIHPRSGTTVDCQCVLTVDSTERVKVGADAAPPWTNNSTGLLRSSPRIVIHCSIPPTGT